MSEIELSKVQSLVELLTTRAACHPQRRAFTFLENGESEAGTWNYGELDRRARAIAARLQQQCKAGDRALLLFAPGLDFVAAFFGCLYAEVIAVPAYPPDPARINRTLPRLLAIANDAQTAVVLTTESILPMAKALMPLAPELAQLSWMATDQVDLAEAESWRSSVIEGDQVAFLQYTSGSTSDPKGVMVSHGNLLHNQEMIQRGFELDDQTIVASWLPMYHDMGLIGHVLQPVYLGGPCVLMSPVAFLRRPLRWLRMISTHRATISTAPNFAYDLCLRKISDTDKQELDLSCWRQALNGAEPVQAETIDAFSDAFAPCGFRRAAFYPCYGLAEATLVVSGAKAAADLPAAEVDATALERHRVLPAEPGRSRRLMASGQSPIEEQTILIVDPQSKQACTAEQIGEIWVSSASVAQGYWRKPLETERIFCAYTAQGQGPFLRTGDLGFIRDGALFVTGRLKDLVIVRGQNYYPQDIERAAERAHPSLRPGTSAAFSVDRDGKDLVVVITEVDRRYSKAPRELDVNGVSETMRAAICKETGLQAHGVVLIKAGTVPKTSSGKIQRRATRELYSKGKLEVVGESFDLR